MCVCMYEYHIVVSIKTLAPFGVCMCVRVREYVCKCAIPEIESEQFRGAHRHRQQPTSHSAYAFRPLVPAFYKE